MDRKRVFGWLAAGAFMLTLGWPARSDPVDARLHGLWQVTVVPNEDAARAGQQVFRDTLLFEEDSSFTAEAFGPMGFAPAAAESGSVEQSFSCTQQNDSQGTLTWSGTSSGRSISGTMTWTKPDGTVYQYSFSGTVRL